MSIPYAVRSYGSITKLDVVGVVHDKRNKTTHAVIHVGPPKTGSTLIQYYSAELVEELARDGYEMP